MKIPKMFFSQEEIMDQNNVLLVLEDGMRADSVAACGNPAYRKYFEEGAYTYKAQTNTPGILLPAFLPCCYSKHRS